MNQTCKICKSESNKIFTKKILGKFEVAYFQCPNCEFIQTENPHWLELAYKEPINVSDTGLLSRNIYLAKITTLLIFFYFNKKGTFLDFAGGYGVFTRLMRDNGFNFLWQDPFTQNLFAKSFEWNKDSKDKVELLTTFECFEHLNNPLKEVENMLAVSDSILFSTEIIPKNNLEKWWYLAPQHGQHISFYSQKTLEFIASKYNLFLSTNGVNLHLLTKNKRVVNFTLLSFLMKTRIDILVKKFLVSKTNSDNQKLQYLDKIK